MFIPHRKHTCVSSRPVMEIALLFYTYYRGNGLTSIVHSTKKLSREVILLLGNCGRYQRELEALASDVTADQ
jgi:hypothetical protein